jgi:hypothetical protein
MDKAEIEYWITKLPIHQLRGLLISIKNEITNRGK